MESQWLKFHVTLTSKSVEARHGMVTMTKSEISTSLDHDETSMFVYQVSCFCLCLCTASSSA